jgi:hypothetical protein
MLPNSRNIYFASFDCRDTHYRSCLTTYQLWGLAVKVSIGFVCWSFNYRALRKWHLTRRKMVFQSQGRGQLSRFGASLSFPSDHTSALLLLNQGEGGVVPNDAVRKAWNLLAYFGYGICCVLSRRSAEPLINYFKNRIVNYE